MRPPAAHYIAYLFPSGPSVHEVVRGALPVDFELCVPASSQRVDLLEVVRDADFVITARLDAEMIRAAERLRLIQLAGVGFDGVDVEEATRCGIPVAQTVEGTISGVAEHAVLLILALFKHLREADASVRRGEWLVWQLRHKSHTLEGKTVGVVGFGRIGRATARRLRAFGARIIYHDVRRAATVVERELSAEPVSLDELLARSDVVTVHAPLTEATRDLIDAAALEVMKPSAILINTSRGGLVDEAALVDALKAGAIAGAGLDVFAEEPLPVDHPLLGLDNVLLTPHIATGTRESILEKTVAACENMQRVLAGKRPLHVVNPGVFDRRRQEAS